MERDGRWSWLAVLGPVLLCLPCLLAPLLALGAGALLAGAGGVLTGTLWLLLAGMGLAVVLAAALLLRRRRRMAACSRPTAERTPAEPLEVN
ncbi:MAG: hypothetical protein AB7R89_01600 [Dehalococcoidia bacterium]